MDKPRKRPTAKPRLIEYDVGRDVQGRPVTLRCETTDGKEVWSIRSTAVAQQDEGGESITDLTAENLRALAAAVS